MNTFIVILAILGVSTIVGILWGKGIINMHEKYPDYKGEDFLNWDGKSDQWDDHKSHTEGPF